jgi:hypothetical protein
MRAFKEMEGMPAMTHDVGVAFSLFGSNDAVPIV